MPLIIKEIEENSLAAKAGITPESKIISINEHPINDFLDLQFFSANQRLNFKIQKDDETKSYVIMNNWESPLGIIPLDHNCRSCVNNCIFCFVDQMKKEERETLYVKDDDYVFSFVFGNFITLTNLTERDYKRILQQSISPLYISVHTTNPILHKNMLRYKKDFNILERLRFLSDHDIAMHTQIVLVPGYNDGVELENTLKDLTNRELNIISIGIVPVGLTKFRTELSDIKPFTKKEAAKIIDLCEKYSGFYGQNPVYCSDELFLKAGKDIPEDEYYDDYPQLENGIGMLRLLLDNWEENKKHVFKKLEKTPANNFCFITGVSAEKYIKQISDEINSHFSTLRTRVQVIQNDFFGRSVTVSGLLAFQDVLAQITLLDNELPVFSTNFFNFELVSIDNYSIKQIKKALNRKIIVIDEIMSRDNFLIKIF